MKILMLFTVFFLSNPLWARSLKASADKLGQETTKIGLALALFGIVMGGIYFILGKNDAGQKMTQVLLGCLAIVCAPAIISFVRGIA